MNFIFERSLTFYDVTVFFMVNQNMIQQFLIPNFSEHHIQLLNQGQVVPIPTYDSQQKKNYTFCLHNIDGVTEFRTIRDGWVAFRNDRNLTVNDNVKFYFNQNPYQLRVSITSPIQDFPKQRRTEKQRIYRGLTQDESIAVDSLLLLSRKVEYHFIKFFFLFFILIFLDSLFNSFVSNDFRQLIFKQRLMVNVNRLVSSFCS